MKKLLIGLGVLVLIVVLSCVACAQGKVSFLWDLVPEDAILGTTGGYHLYASKTSGVYTGTTPIATVAPGVSTVTVTTPGLGTWYFVVTAFSAGTESGYSNEVNQVFAPSSPANLKITIPASSGYAK